MIALLPPNENERLITLRRFAILDTPREPSFDRIASLAAHLLDVPIALLTLIDENRQWFKACHGVEVDETSRSMSFCAHTILQDEIMVVPDATQDIRFADNPLVTGDFGLRFYAGVPLKAADGSNLGSLCIVDTKPRELNADEKAILKDLEGIVMHELELRLAILEKNPMETAVFNIPSGVVITDPFQADNPIIYCNPAFCELTGYSHDEIIGRNCRFLQGKETDEIAVQMVRKALEDCVLFDGLLLNYRKDGTPFWNELIISPVFDHLGNLQHFVGLQNDVTATKEAEGVQERYEDLKRLEKLRDNLNSMIIHDMRSPLSVTIGFLDILKNDNKWHLNDEAMESIKYAEEGALQLKEMVTSLLDVSRLEVEKMPMEMGKCELGGLVKTSLGHQLAMPGNSRLILKIPYTPLTVRCDKNLLSRVINNLVGNALNFTPKPGKVRVTVFKKDLNVHFSVTDTGPGIALKDQEKIFEKFTQLEDKQRPHSTGLGLTFCKLAIEAQGGVIGLESELGKGATFWFTLPDAAQRPKQDDRQQSGNESSFHLKVS